jgi:streptomycin 6-kinase
VLVDPAGFREDPAYALGVVLRDFSTHLTGPDAQATLRGWCEALGDRTGLDPQHIWEWAFLERVSTGLYVLGFGAERVAAPYLTTAANLAR